MTSRGFKTIGSLGAAAVLCAAFSVSATAQEPAQASFFANGEQEAFEQAVADRGLQVDAAEDFEDAKPSPGFLGLLPSPATGAFDDPLDAQSDNQFFEPGQIPASLRIQSNKDNPGTGTPNPVGQFGLAVGRPSSAGQHGSPTTISSPVNGSDNEGTTSTDVIAVDAAHEAYALDISLVEFSFVEPGTDPIGGPLLVTAFDEGGGSLGSATIDQEDIGPFFGVIAPEGTEIGTINVAAPTSDSELIHALVAYDADGGKDMGRPPKPGNGLGDLLGGLGLEGLGLEDLGLGDLGL